MRGDVAASDILTKDRRTEIPALVAVTGEMLAIKASLERRRDEHGLVGEIGVDDRTRARRSCMRLRGQIQRMLIISDHGARLGDIRLGEDGKHLRSDAGVGAAELEAASQRPSVASRCASMKVRNARIAGSLRAVITALLQSRQPQNGCGHGDPGSPRGLS